ncbi:MAG: hypothetical protein AAB678_00335 [Patescibacteria group bacterium]
MLTNNALENIKKYFGTALTPAKNTRYANWRLLSLSVFGLLLAGALWTGYFIYQNIFFTLSNVNAIVVLSTNLTADVVDFPNFQKVRNLIEEKKNLPPLPANIRDIFAYLPTSTYAVTSAKK